MIPSRALNTGATSHQQRVHPCREKAPQLNVSLFPPCGQVLGSQFAKAISLSRASKRSSITGRGFNIVVPS